MRAVGIIGTGRALPERVVTNHDFVKMGLDTTDEWITERTGIKKRHIADKDIKASDLGYEAALNALENAGINADEIDLIIVTTSTPDYSGFPSTAAIIQEKLKLNTVGAFDLFAACTGFSYGLTCGAQFVQTGFAKKVLVIGTECYNKIVNWQDRSTCILFGDGAGAVVISEVEQGYGILASEIHSDGQYKDILAVEYNGDRVSFSQEISKYSEPFVKMNGRAVFKVAVEYVIPVTESIIAKAGLEVSNIKYLILHQANLRIMNLACEKLGFTKDQVFCNIQKYGNTSSASIPIALSELNDQKKIKKGDYLVLVGFGAGFTWGGNVIKWGV